MRKGFRLGSRCVKNAVAARAWLASVSATCVGASLTFSGVGCGGDDGAMSKVTRSDDGAPGAAAAGTANGGNAGVRGSDGSAAASGAGAAASEDASADDAPTSDDAADAGPDGAAGSDADSGESGAVPEDGPDSAPPVSKYCGDGVRDPLLEECDDGPGQEADSCNASCETTTLTVAPLPPPAGFPTASRRLGLGRHPISSGPQGHGIVLLDVRTSKAELLFSSFDVQGRPQVQGLAFGRSATTSPMHNSEPVVSALPDGGFVTAWTDLAIDKDQRGIALRRITPTSSTTGSQATLGAPFAANTRTGFNQENPDLVWTGSELVVAWAEQGVGSSYDVSVRSFSSALVPLASQQTIAGSSSDELHVALAPFAGSYALAWRSIDGASDETVHIRAGTTSWSVGPHMPPNAFDRPSLVALDSTRLLLVFSADSAPLGSPEQSRLRAAVLDIGAPGATSAFELEPPVPVSGVTTSQTQPVAARAGNRVYVAWRQTDSPRGAQAEELWLKEVPWTASPTAQPGAIVLDLAKPAITIPPEIALRANNQHVPALSASGDALLIAWNDDSRTGASPEVMARLSAVPVRWTGRNE